VGVIKTAMTAAFGKDIYYHDVLVSAKSRLLNILMGADYFWSMLGHSPWMPIISEGVRRHGNATEGTSRSGAGLKGC